MSDRCDATIDQKIRCELAPEHEGRHTNGLLVWHEPPIVLLGEQHVPVDLETNTEHWLDGDVRFSWQEPSL